MESAKIIRIIELKFEANDNESDIADSGEAEGDGSAVRKTIVVPIRYVDLRRRKNRTTFSVGTVPHPLHLFRTPNAVL